MANPAGLWTSDRRLYLDRSGRVVEADDPARASLLVAAGGTLPRARAEALGLVAPASGVDDPARATAQADTAAAARKGRGKAPANKRREAPANKAPEPADAGDTVDPDDDDSE